jgi:hypothetical protein
VRENLERYKNKQPVINSKQQLSEKVVDKDVVRALQQTGYITPQHLILINTVLTMPAATVEAEYRRRIAAINAVAAFCDVSEGISLRRPNPSAKRPAPDAVASIRVKQQQPSQEDKDVTL